MAYKGLGPFILVVLLHGASLLARLPNLHSAHFAQSHSDCKKRCVHDFELVLKFGPITESSYLEDGIYIARGFPSDLGDHSCH